MRRGPDLHRRVSGHSDPDPSIFDFCGVGSRLITCVGFAFAGANVKSPRVARASNDAARDLAQAKESSGVRAEVLNAMKHALNVKKRELLGSGVDDGPISGFELTDFEYFDELKF